MNIETKDLEKELIETTFKKYGNVRAAAKELGIDASTLVRKRKKYKNKNKCENVNVLASKN